jgi:hypothetical protein
MLSAEDSPARTLAFQARALESKASEADCGQSMPASFARYVPESSSWRTAQRSLFEGLNESWVTWPRQGLMLNGACYQRAPLVLHTHGSECSLWPTPNLPNGGRSVPKDAIWKTNTTAYKANGKKIQVGLESALRRIEGSGSENPRWREWLMGFPIGWTNLEDSETPSSHKSPNGSAEES